MIYKENEGIITYTETSPTGKERPLLIITPGVFFAHPDDGDHGGGHGHALKEPLTCNVANKNQKCFEWPGKTCPYSYTLYIIILIAHDIT